MQNFCVNLDFFVFGKNALNPDFQTGKIFIASILPCEHKNNSDWVTLEALYGHINTSLLVAPKFAR